MYPGHHGEQNDIQNKRNLSADAFHKGFCFYPEDIYIRGKVTLFSIDKNFTKSDGTYDGRNMIFLSVNGYGNPILSICRKDVGERNILSFGDNTIKMNEWNFFGLSFEALENSTKFTLNINGVYKTL